MPASPAPPTRPPCALTGQGRYNTRGRRRAGCRVVAESYDRGRGHVVRPAPARPHRETRSLVDLAPRHRLRAHRVRPLLARRRDPGLALPLHGGRRALPLAVLLAGPREPARRRHPVLAGAPRPLGAVGPAAHLLLLP